VHRVHQALNCCTRFRQSSMISIPVVPLPFSLGGMVSLSLSLSPLRLVPASLPRQILEISRTDLRGISPPSSFLGVAENARAGTGALRRSNAVNNSSRARVSKWFVPGNSRERRRERQKAKRRGISIVSREGTLTGFSLGRSPGRRFWISVRFVGGNPESARYENQSVHDALIFSVGFQPTASDRSHSSECCRALSEHG